MTFVNRIALACLAVSILLNGVFGLVYLAASEVMPYHKHALGVPWPDLTPGVRKMLVLFLNQGGSTALSLSIALAFLVVGPLRRGEPWARWAVLCAGLPSLGSATYFSIHLALSTGADTPWKSILAIAVLFMTGGLLAPSRQPPNQALHPPPSSQPD